MLLGTNEVLLLDSIVTASEQATLIAWIEEQRKAEKLIRNPVDNGVYSTAYQSARGGLTELTRRRDSRDLIWIPEVHATLDSLPDVCETVRARVIERLNIADLEEDAYKGSFLSYTEPGASIHQHRDEFVNAGTEVYHVLRCNILFKKPEAGGLPVFNGTPVEVADRGMWAFFPTSLVHAATPVGGSSFRGVFSFGFLVDSERIWQRGFRVAPEVRSNYGLVRGNGVGRAIVDKLREANGSDVDVLRLAVLEFIFDADDGFRTIDVATAADSDPAMVWNVLRDLQRSNVIESFSATSARGGKVLVF